jgi:hypothetical protein
MKVDMVIPQTVTDCSSNPIDGTFTVTSIVSSAFQGTAITSIEIQAPITEIPNSTFQDCSQLTTIKFRDTVTRIEYRAFQNCESLVDIDISNVTNLGSYVFSGCKSLKHITLGDVTNYRSIGTLLIPL